MNMDSKVINTLLAATLLLGLSSVDNVARAADAPAPANMEKCYGVVKAGMNDCDSADVANCDKSVLDADPNYWIWVPKGLCNKLVGGLTNIGAKPGAAAPGTPAATTAPAGTDVTPSTTTPSSMPSATPATTTPSTAAPGTTPSTTTSTPSAAPVTPSATTTTPAPAAPSATTTTPKT